MKKCLLSLLLILGTLCSRAQTISLTELAYDDENGYYYFDVKVEGEFFYVGYGADVQLPAGLVCVKNDSDNPRIRRIAGLYPKNDDDEYYHTISSSFPDPSDLTHVRVACYSGSNKQFKSATGTLFRVCVNKTCTATQWPIGEIKAYDVELNVDAETRYYPGATTQIVAMFEGTSTLPLTINPSNHWSTCILPFDAAIPAGVKAYTVGGHDSKNLLLSEAGSFAAYTPYILYSESGYSGNVSGTVDPDQCPVTGVVNRDDYLNGAIVAQNVTSGYVMQNLQSEGVKFYQITEGTFNVPAGKCWMTLPAGGPVKGLGFMVENESAIEQIKTPESHIIYNLAGQQVQNPQKGIYIVNGKKVMY